MSQSIRFCCLTFLLVIFVWLPPLTMVHAEVNEPTVARFPFSDNFESGVIGPNWATDSSGSGRVEISTDDVYAGANSIFMGQKTGGRSGAHLILTIDLSNQDDVFLDFWWRAVDNGSYDNYSGVYIIEIDG